MTQPPPINPPPESPTPPRDDEVQELEGRIETLETLDDSALGSFTSLDWVIVVLGSVLIPGVWLWWVA